MHDIEMTRGEEVIRPRQHAGFIRQNLWGAFWAVAVCGTLAWLA